MTNRRRVLVIAMSVAVGSAGAGLAATPSTPAGYVCARAATPLRIDGRLDDPAWSEAVWTDDFVDIEGDVRPRPPLRTRVKMLWDDEYLYVGAELVEPHVWATLTQHDSVIFKDHDFEVFIDPNGDSHEYYEYEVNALGTDWDLLLPWPYKDGGRALNSWEIAGLQKAVHVDGTLNDPTDTDRGWSVELAFPWRVLGQLARCPAPPHEGDQWRVNFSRVEWDLEQAAGGYRKIAGRPEHNWVWSPQGVVNMHRPESWGYVQFTAKPPAGVAFQPDRALPARLWLQEVYYAQQEFRRTHSRWAKTLTELGVAPPPAPLTSGTLEVTSDLFQASVELSRSGLGKERWNIRQDALVWPTGTTPAR
jgi:hypothetical protein